MQRRPITLDNSRTRAYCLVEAVEVVWINRIYDGVETETRKSQASFQII